METCRYILCFIVLVYLFNFNRGQFIPQEEVRNMTTCGLHTNVDITCSSDGVIAIQSLYFYYHPECEETCCSYDSSHYRADPDKLEINTITRHCSGKTDCSIIGLNEVRDFGVSQIQEPSYLVIHYYCLTTTSITSICGGTDIVSLGEPVYLTNEGYPEVPTGDSTCSCSMEVYSCTSIINVYIIDADMYSDVDNCEQNIDFLDGRNRSLDKIDCQSYDYNGIVSKQLTTNYIKIYFDDKSFQNLEGYFFLGFGVSEETTFKLSCSFEEQLMCKDCGTPVSIQHGRLDLADAGNSSFGALANVVCNIGYEPDDTTVSCLETGIWKTTTCNSKATVVLSCICAIQLVIIACLLVYVQRIKRRNETKQEGDDQPHIPQSFMVAHEDQVQPASNGEPTLEISLNDYERLDMYENSNRTGEVYQQLEIVNG